jgi:Mg/Co/Ni transporter MgtE
MLQQVQQFRSLGEDFAMQHKDSEYLGEVEEELQTAVLDAIPAERIVRRVARDPNDDLQTAVLEAIPAEKRLRGLSPEERLRGLSLEELLGGLSKEQAARLREFLENGQGH